MSGQETRIPAADCDKIVERAIILTSDAWKMLRNDIQMNCQFAECKQISGAADNLFLTIDSILNNIPSF